MCVCVWKRFWLPTDLSLDRPAEVNIYLINRGTLLDDCSS